MGSSKGLELSDVYESIREITSKYSANFSNVYHDLEEKGFNQNELEKLPSLIEKLIDDGAVEEMKPIHPILNPIKDS